MGNFLFGTCLLISFQLASAEWAAAPKQINPNPGDQNPHYNSGGRRIVRINGTTIALAPTGYQRDHMFRSVNNGAAWADIDPDGNYSGSLISGPDSLVFHFYADFAGGALRMVRFKYNAAVIPAPVLVYSSSALSQSSVLHEYRAVNAIVDSAGTLYVATHWGSPDRMYVFRSENRGDTWSGPFQINSDVGKTWYYPHLEVDARNNLMATYHENGGNENLMFAKSTDRGQTWTNRVIHSRSGSNLTANPSLLTAGPDTAYIFFQGILSVRGVFVTRSVDGGNTWGPFRTVEETCEYGDPSPAIGADGALYAAFRSSRNTGVSGGCGDASREKLSRSVDKGATWQAVDSLYQVPRTGTRSQMRYQAWWNYGGPLEWIWMQYGSSGRPIFYDINTDAAIFDRKAGGGPPGGTENRAPVIESMTVDKNPVMRSDSSLWQVVARDPDGDAMSYQWYVDGFASGTGPTFRYRSTAGCAMAQTVEVRIADAKGGTVVRSGVQNLQDTPAQFEASWANTTTGLAERIAASSRPGGVQARDGSGRLRPELLFFVPGGAAPEFRNPGIRLRLVSAGGRLSRSVSLADLRPGWQLLALSPLQGASTGRFQVQILGGKEPLSIPVTLLP